MSQCRTWVRKSRSWTSFCTSTPWLNVTRHTSKTIGKPWGTHGNTMENLWHHDALWPKKVMFMINWVARTTKNKNLTSIKALHQAWHAVKHQTKPAIRGTCTKSSDSPHYRSTSQLVDDQVWVNQLSMTGNGKDRSIDVYISVYTSIYIYIYFGVYIYIYACVWMQRITMNYVEICVDMYIYIYK